MAGGGGWDLLQASERRVGLGETGRGGTGGLFRFALIGKFVVCRWYRGERPGVGSGFLGCVPMPGSKGFQPQMHTDAHRCRVPLPRFQPTSQDGAGFRRAVPLGSSACIGVHLRLNISSAQACANKVRDKIVSVSTRRRKARQPEDTEERLPAATLCVVAPSGPSCRLRPGARLGSGGAVPVVPAPSRGLPALGGASGGDCVGRLCRAVLL